MAGGNARPGRTSARGSASVVPLSQGRDAHLDRLRRATALARESIERGRRLRAEERAERTAAQAAWTPTEAARRRWATFEGETHTAAELDSLRLPYRFQLYAREVILPSERLLVSLHRPALPVGQWPLGRRSEREALVILTTRQLLLLSDARPPDTMVRFGGFVARTTAVERLQSVSSSRTTSTACSKCASQVPRDKPRGRSPCPRAQRRGR